VRCFVALDLPAPVRDHLVEITQPLRSRYDIRWVPADQLHLTLVFDGDLSTAALDELAEVVRRIELPPMSLHLQGLGHFPPRGMPRVVWAGFGGDLEALGALHEQLAARAAVLGVPREKRGFVPHATLGRVRSPFGVLAMVDQLKSLGAGLKDKPFAPTGLVLYTSELRPTGPVHTPLVRRPCPAPAP
jgi:2'-5' RNA ligase